jgi:DNA-binding NtrC family response regulator
MSGSPLVVISGSAEYARPIQAELSRALNRPVDFISIEAVLAEGPARSDGVWFLAPSTPDEGAAMADVVRAARLQLWPAILFALETTAASPAGPLPASTDFRPGRRRPDPQWLAAPAGPLSVLASFYLPEDLPLLAERARPFVARLFEEGWPPDETAACRQWLRQTPSLSRAADYLAQVAAHDVVLLIVGETGTGKTYLARALHEASPRRGKPFLVVPCGSLPQGLSESAFFGHVKGAFTGAERTVSGKFTAAGEGTILLDEIDTLGLKEQASLLRIIETGEFEPIGSHETQRSRARVLVASNADLEQSVAAGRFREDLYYRLSALSFFLPPLRERPEDVVTLACSLAARIARQMKKDIRSIHQDVFTVLMEFHWPGNIRQLQNVLQQAILMCRTSELLPEHLPDLVRVESQPQALRGPTLAFNNNKLAGTGSRVEQVMVRRALENSGNCRVRAARLLGISRVTLYKKLKKYGLEDFPSAASSDAIG